MSSEKRFWSTWLAPQAAAGASGAGAAGGLVAISVAATALRTCVQSAAVMPTVPTRLSHAWPSAEPRSA